MSSPIEQFYISKEEPLRSTLMALRDIMLDHESELRSEWKYNMPCFTYRSKPIAYLWIDKITNEPYILWVYGKDLDFSQLEQGSRSKMKILRIDSSADIPLELIHDILKQSINICAERMKW